MEIFKSIAGINNAEQTTTSLNQNLFNIEIGGKLEVDKGEFKMSFTYWARVYEFGDLPGVIGIDEYEPDNEQAFISGIKIDDLNAFKNGLKTNGLETISKSFEVNKDKAVLDSLKTNPIVHKVFGKKAIIWQTLSELEQKEFLYKAISEGIKVHSYRVRAFGWCDDNNVILPIEQIEELWKQN